MNFGHNFAIFNEIGHNLTIFDEILPFFSKFHQFLANNSPGRALNRAEDAVAAVAEAGQDITAIIQFLVEHR